MAHVSYRSTLPQRSAKFKAGMPLLVEKTAADATAIAIERSRVDSSTMRDNWHFEMVGPTKAIVGNPIEWSVYNEYGTRFMSSQPMIRPATAQVAPAFFAGAKRLMD